MRVPAVPVGPTRAELRALAGAGATRERGRSARLDEVARTTPPAAARTRGRRPERAGVTTRPREVDDEAHLRALYTTTRAAELAAWGWPDAEAEQFLGLQYRAHERSLPGDADDRVVELDGRPVGRLVVDRSNAVVRLLDVAILPQARGAGIGSRLLAALCAEVDAVGRTIELCVLPGSPAVRLFERLGFRAVGSDGLHTLMRREPGVPA